MFASMSCRKVCKVVLLLDVLFVLSMVACVPPVVLFVLPVAVFPDVPRIAETRLSKSDCSVLRVPVVEEVDEVEEVLPNS